MSPETKTQAALEVLDLTVAFGPSASPHIVLSGISFQLGKNEILGIVGETGAGKSVLAQALLGLLPGDGRITQGSVTIAGKPIAAMSEGERRRLRGGTISLIGTNAKALLDPVERVGKQISRVLRIHRPCSRGQAWKETIDLLDKVGIVDPERRARAYPHELSGGMAQRIIIAMALITHPAIILADDATLGLDATVQVQVLDLLVERARQLGVSVVLITHDLGIIAHYCDRVAVMRDGKIEELQPVEHFLAQPQTAYSTSLLGAARAKPTRGDRLAAPVASAETGMDKDRILVVDNLCKTFDIGGGQPPVIAVDRVSFSLERGETLALVGESGSGKTTIGQCLLRLLPPNSGVIRFDGQDIATMEEPKLRPLRRRMQMVFQEPYVALNPRWRVSDLIAEPLDLLDRVPQTERRRRVDELLEMVQLPQHLARAYPHELTAGEQKRIGIARALATKPDFVVFDEPTTALDIRVRAQIIDLIRALQQDMGLSALFITHDLNSVRSLAHNVIVLNRGRIVELGLTEEIFEAPKDPYTRTLLAAELPIEWSDTRRSGAGRSPVVALGA
ncbi:ABC transporter ATP-binding protein [Acidisoma cellulosilytica]|uniref:ABC transporter ATP-binding protein n=1 Tax=Acidisoma cellulosilyticum TaxID=2802395 RepID=A0A963Z253_9PROT|nr:ABC transporter ATP-binding protein [Acidisoma cellulosilyticum]MCB8881344.1 ABC transporter ATP-binding protein [Acidisoma cellulosilyticum]